MEMGSVKDSGFPPTSTVLRYSCAHVSHRCNDRALPFFSSVMCKDACFVQRRHFFMGIFQVSPSGVHCHFESCFESRSSQISKQMKACLFLNQREKAGCTQPCGCFHEFYCRVTTSQLVLRMGRPKCPLTARAQVDGATCRAWLNAIDDAFRCPVETACAGTRPAATRTIQNRNRPPQGRRFR